MESRETNGKQITSINRIGGRKFAYLLVLTGLLAAFIGSVVFGRQTEMIIGLLENFFTIYMFIALAIVAGNVIEKIPFGKFK